MMILESLSMYRYHTGEMSGSITFKNEASQIELKLDEANCNKILEICADQLLKTSKEVATNLTTNMINSLKLIESKDSAL